MAKIVIIYGSTGGNTEFTVERVAELLVAANHQVDLRRVEQFDDEDLLKEVRKSDFVVLASPTYGHGQLQEDMVPFVKKLQQFDLKGKPFAVIGLGDPKYDDHYHIESTFILEDILNKANGTKLHYALRISRSPVLQVNNLIPKWSRKFIDKIAAYNG